MLEQTSRQQRSSFRDRPGRGLFAQQGLDVRVQPYFSGKRALAEDLPQSLLTLLEDETRWAIEIGLASDLVPDFVRILAPKTLTGLAPERVTLIH